MVSALVSFLPDVSSQLGPKKLRGLNSLPGQQLLEHIYARAGSATLLRGGPAEFPSCHKFASSFICSIIHRHSYIKK